MHFQKKYLEIFIKTLKESELSLAEARFRDSLAKALVDAYNQYLEDRATIFKKFCDKNLDGSPTIVEDQYHFKSEVLDDVNAELIILGDEEITFSSDPEKAKQIIEKTEYKAKTGEALSVDELLNQLSKV